MKIFVFLLKILNMFFSIILQLIFGTYWEFYKGFWDHFRNYPEVLKNLLNTEKVLEILHFFSSNFKTSSFSICHLFLSFFLSASVKIPSQSHATVPWSWAQSSPRPRLAGRGRNRPATKSSSYAKKNLNVLKYSSNVQAECQLHLQFTYWKKVKTLNSIVYIFFI